MVKLNLKGNEFEIKFNPISSSRSAVQFRNSIISSLKKVGVPSHYVSLKEVHNPLSKVGAEVFWYTGDVNCCYNYDRQGSYVNNLQVIAKLIEIEVNKVVNGEKEIQDFVLEFREDDEEAEKRKEARATLQVAQEEKDLEVITKQYKKMAKELHPDTENGDAEKFKRVNEAHKILKKELE